MGKRWRIIETGGKDGGVFFAPSAKKALDAWAISLGCKNFRQMQTWCCPMHYKVDLVPRIILI